MRNHSEIGSRRAPRAVRRRIAAASGGLVATAGLFSFAAPAAANVTPEFPFDQLFNAAHAVNATVKSQSPTDPLFHQIEMRLHPGPAGGLTADSPVWTGYLRQTGRIVTLNLGTPETIGQISLQFFQNASQGIVFPKFVEFQVSLNGTAWYQAGTVDTSVPRSAPGQMTQTYTVNLHNISAQYVRVQFPVNTWVFARDLQVMASPWIQPSLTQLPSQAVAPQAASGPLLVSNPAAAGVKNMLLVYSGGNGALGTWTPASFRPMVAYLSPSGQVQGAMFDSFLFIPYGPLLYNSLSWEQYMNSLFTPGQQLSALNQTVASLEQGLGGQGGVPSSVNVVLTIPYPNPSETNFGALPGTTQPLDFNPSDGQTASYQNRLAAVNWYVQALLQKWNAAHFTHLNLVGLYWDAESIDPAIPHELDLVQQTSKIVHAAGLKFFWIPTFDSPKSWYNAGFDAILMQSGYYGTPGLSTARLSEAANECSTLGLGLEIEMGNQILTSRAYRARYYDQLVADYLNGMEGQVVHAYYAGSQVLVQAAESHNPAVYNLYMDTHDFLLGQFTYRTLLPQNNTSNP